MSDCHLIHNMSFADNMDDFHSQIIDYPLHILFDVQAYCKKSWQNIYKKVVRTKILKSLKKQMRLLLFSYYYPPLGGPGVQRPCRMVYYFRKNGWDVDVISVKDIVFHSYDRVMLKECRENSVHRVRSWDLMSLFHWLKRSRDFKEEKIYFKLRKSIKGLLEDYFQLMIKLAGCHLLINRVWNYAPKLAMMQSWQR